MHRRVRWPHVQEHVLDLDAVLLGDILIHRLSSQLHGG